MTVQFKKRAVLKLILRVAITVTLLVIVLSQVDLQEIGQAVKNAQFKYLIVIWLLSIVALYIMSFKLQLILRKLECPVHVGTLFRASAITALYSLILPGMLSTGVKWYILKRHTGKGSRVLSSMIYNQLTDIYFRILLGLITIAAAFPSRNKTIHIVFGISSIFLILIYILLLNKHTGVKVNNAIGYLLKPFPKVIRDNIQIILNQLKIFQTTEWSFHLFIAFINLFIAVLGVAIFIYAAKAAAISVPVSGLVWQSSAIYILGRLPISIANCGVREWSLIGCMSFYGIGKAQTLLMSGIIFTAAIFRAIVGALCLLFKTAKNDKNPGNDIVGRESNLKMD